EPSVVKVAEKASAPAVRSRPGQYLNAAKAEPVVFSRERILVNADLADRFLGRHLSAGKAVYIDLAAVGARCRAGKCLQSLFEFLGIVRKSLKLVLAKNRCTRRRVGIGRDL